MLAKAGRFWVIAEITVPNYKSHPRGISYIRFLIATRSKHTTKPFWPSILGERFVPVFCFSTTTIFIWPYRKWSISLNNLRYGSKMGLRRCDSAIANGFSVYWPWAPRCIFYTKYIIYKHFCISIRSTSASKKYIYIYNLYIFNL